MVRGGRRPQRTMDTRNGPEEYCGGISSQERRLDAGRKFSLVDVRRRISAAMTDPRRDVIVLALDGIPLALARQHWPHADIEAMSSVFPTTSSSAWLSSVTGQTVAEHGIPGVVFRLDGPEPINVYDFRGELAVPDRGSLFSDAVAAGYRAIALSADLEAAPGPWLDALLRDAHRVGDDRFYARSEALSAQELVDSVRAAVARERRQRTGTPQLIWCFVEVDRHIHRYGYDAHALDVLTRIDALASAWAADGVEVIAYSDHGLVPTRHVPDIQAAIDDVSRRFRCAAGGAGRTRWFYPLEQDREAMSDFLRARFGGIARVAHAAECFDAGMLARGRVGDVLLIAEGDEFTTFDGHCYDHGSWTPTEVAVPFAQWRI